MKYTEQDLKDEYEQAIKRKGKMYADGYVEGLKDAQSQALTIPVVVDEFYCDIVVGEEGYRCKEQCEMCKDYIDKQQ